jgi:hypothetical protein
MKVWEMRDRLNTPGHKVGDMPHGLGTEGHNVWVLPRRLEVEVYKVCVFANGLGGPVDRKIRGPGGRLVLNAVFGLWGVGGEQSTGY